MSLPKKIALFLAVFAVLGGAFIINAPKVKALTVEELQAQIDALLKQLATLQAQLAEMQGTTTWCYDFNRNLKFGVGGEEVRALQTALQKQGFYTQAITGTFDEYTASAVVGFQEKYASEILTPWGLAHGTGFVGRTTRAKLNALYGCKVTPSITVLSPNGGEQWVIGNTYEIKWNATKNIQTVRIELANRLASSAFHELIAESTSNDGSFLWTIPEIISTFQAFGGPESGYVVGISTTSEVDYSDNYFSIVENPAEITCTDSDGGKDYYVKGYVYSTIGSQAPESGWDGCLDNNLQSNEISDSSGKVISPGTGTKVSETFCNSQNMYEIKITDCLYGCYNGACKLGVKLSPATPVSHEVAAGASYFPIGASSEVAHKFLSFEIDNPSSHSVSINKLAVAIEGTAKPSDFGEVIWQADGKSVDSGSNSFREVGGAGYAETPDSLYYPNGATLLTIPANSKKTIEVFAYVKSTATIGATAKFTMYANYVRAVEGFNFGGLPISGNTMTISKKSLSAEIKYQGTYSISAKAGSSILGSITIANKSSEEIKITEAVMGDPTTANNFLTYTDKNNYSIQYYDGNGTLTTAQLKDAGKNTSDGYRLFNISPGLTIPAGKEISFVVSAKLNSVISAKEFTIIFNKFSGYGATTFSPVVSVGKTTGKINVSQQTSSLKDVENSLASVYNAISALIDALRQGQVEK